MKQLTDCVKHWRLNVSNLIWLLILSHWGNNLNLKLLIVGTVCWLLFWFCQIDGKPFLKYHHNWKWTKDGKWDFLFLLWNCFNRIQNGTESWLNDYCKNIIEKRKKRKMEIMREDEDENDDEKYYHWNKGEYKMTQRMKVIIMMIKMRMELESTSIYHLHVFLVDFSIESNIRHESKFSVRKLFESSD